MSESEDRKNKALEDAFQAFNLMSQELEASYKELDQKVAQLNAELAAARDERMRYLAEKEKIANRLEHILAALPGGVVVLDDNQTVVECNAAAIQILGEPLLGEGWSQVQAQRFSSQSRGNEWVSNDGRVISLSARSLGNEPGQILLLNDVTETRDLQQLVSRQERLSAMGEMAASLAHQIRTPLASAMLYISHLNHPQINEAKRSQVSDKLLGRLRQIEQQINDMLLYAKGEKPGDEVISLEGLLDCFGHAFEPLANEQGCTLEMRAHVEGAEVSGNSEALLGALLNIANNGIQAGGKGTQVTLTAQLEEGEAVRLCLRDNGPGIAAEIQKQIFDPFFTTRPDGTGLGLAVVESVIKAHAGLIRCESAPGEGTLFEIRLPLRHASDALMSGDTQGEQEDKTGNEVI